MQQQHSQDQQAAVGDTNSLGVSACATRWNRASDSQYFWTASR